MPCHVSTPPFCPSQVKVVQVLHQGGAALGRGVVALGALAAGHHIGARRGCAQGKKGRRGEGCGRAGAVHFTAALGSLQRKGSVRPNLGCVMRARQDEIVGAGLTPRSRFCSRVCVCRGLEQ